MSTMQRITGLLAVLLVMTMNIGHAEFIEPDNVNSLYQIAVNEELRLPKPDWKNRTDSGYYAFYPMEELTVYSETDSTIVSVTKPGVYTIEAWIEIDGIPYLKWVTIAASDSENALLPAQMRMDYYDSYEQEWHFNNTKPRTLMLSSKNGAWATFNITNFKGLYNYYHDFPVWSIRRISGPEYAFTASMNEWVDHLLDGETRKEIDGTYSVSFSMNHGQEEDATYIISMSYHGWEIHQILTVHPVPDAL